MRIPVERVLQIHTRYREAGGEDRVVDDERRLLTEAGVEVHQVMFDNADIPDLGSPRANISVAMAAVWSRSAAERVRSAVRAFRPDLVHVHNTFVMGSPSVFWAAKRLSIPVVHTLHNYRVVCPAATCFRDGHRCTDCVGRALPWPGVVHACVRDSQAQSLVAAAVLTGHRAAGTWSTKIDRYVALTEFQRELLVQGGLPSNRIAVVSNFLEPDPGSGAAERGGILYVGRLAPEKGPAVLAAAATVCPGVVRVVGDGPDARVVEEAAASGALTALGRVTPAAVRGEMASALALVVPSLWFEGFPMVVLEAYASGTPVIASRIGSLAEVVEDGVTGLLVAPDDARELGETLLWATEHPAEMREMGARARRRYEERYRGSVHLKALLSVYAEAARASHAPA